jgi:hypothetical protein
MEMVQELDLASLPRRVLEDLTFLSPLVSDDYLLSLYNSKIDHHDSMDIVYKVHREYGDMSITKSIRFIALCEETIAVVGEGKCCVWLFDKSSGEEMFTIGSRGGGPGQFLSPNGIVFDREGNIFIGDKELCKVQVFDIGGNYLRDVRWPFRKPYGIAFTPEGDLVVVDGDSVLVLRESAGDIHLVCSFGSTGSEEGMFLLPRGVAVGMDGSIVVADFGNCRVQIFDKQGVFQKSFVQVISNLYFVFMSTDNPNN